MSFWFGSCFVLQYVITADPDLSIKTRQCNVTGVLECVMATSKLISACN